MPDNNITATGRLTRDAEVRFTASGVAVASFCVAWNERVKRNDQWEDGPANFLDVSAWRGLAESCAELRKGQRVIVSGVMKQREYETREGEKRKVWELTAEEVGVCLDKFAPKAQQSGGWQKPAASDPWAQQSNDNPPF